MTGSFGEAGGSLEAGGAGFRSARGAQLAGAKAERRTAAVLDQFAATSSAVVLHDLIVTTGGREWNIDHLVIGPSGVIVVDSKAWKALTMWTTRSGRCFRGTRRWFAPKERFTPGETSSMASAVRIIAGAARGATVVGLVAVWPTGNGSLDVRRMRVKGAARVIHADHLASVLGRMVGRGRLNPNATAAAILNTPGIRLSSQRAA